MLNKSFKIEYQNDEEEEFITSAETLEEALETRINLIEEGYQNVKIESVRS